MSDRTDYTNPATIDTDIVRSEINNAFRVRGHTWTDRLSWPNITVKALADRIAELEAENAALRETILGVDWGATDE